MIVELLIAALDAVLAAGLLLLIALARGQLWAAPQYAAARQVAIDALVTHSSVKDRALCDPMTLQGLDPDAKLYVAALQEQPQYFLAAGAQWERIDLGQVVDERHIQVAVRKLGPYR